MFAERFARYWMNTCVDAEKMNVDIGNKQYYGPDKTEPHQLGQYFFHVPYNSLKSGIIPKTTTSTIFSGVAKAKSKEAGDNSDDEPEERQCNVLICPVYLSAASKHGKQQNKDSRGIVRRITPVWIPAILREKDGALLSGESGSPWIPREYLEPVDTFGRTAVLGTVKDLDEYVTQKRGSVDLEDWRDMFRYATGMAEYVINAGLKENERKRITDLAVDEYEIILCDDLTENAGIVLPLGEKDKRANNTTIHIEKLFGSMLRSKHFPTLFRNLISYDVPELQPYMSTFDRNAASSWHVGQMGGKYPLADSQREALHHVLLMKDEYGDNLVAVNGPPGTGKTTLIQSIVASLWVGAAIEAAEPPLIFGTSANNRPVKNIIECFEKTELPDQKMGWVSLLKDRWISGVTSYGVFCGRKSEKGNRASADSELTEGKYQLILKPNDSNPQFFDKLFREEYFPFLQNEYLENAAGYINWRREEEENLEQKLKPLCKMSTVADVVEILHKEMKHIYETQNKLLEVCYEEKKIGKQIAELLVADGEKDVEIYIEKLKDEIAGAEELSEKIRESKSKFIKSPKPFWLVLKARFGFAKTEMIKRNREICENCKSFYDITARLPSTSYEDDKMILRGYDDALREAGTDHNRWIEALHEIISLKDRQNACLMAAEQALGSLGLSEDDSPHGGLDNIDQLLDTRTRYRLFLLATHYWEGKWLIEASQLLEEKRKSGRDDVFSRGDQWSLKQWRNYAKLTPCFVATVFRLPNFLTNQGNPLYEGIDYLIVDEAGQVAPEVVAGCFALAKKAIVVGDTQQIEPVWRVTSPVDEGNILKHKLRQDLPAAIQESSDPLKDRGLTSYEGNILKAVQGRIRYSSTGDESQRGIMLREHFRCVPEVIQYCNELAYKGKLIPSRKGIDGYILPHLGYAHVRGTCEKRGGSRCNEEEAECIVKWITDNIDCLKRYYVEKEKKDINEGELIAVVTPFAPQATIIRDLLSRAGRGNLTAGTTHTLQGAERKVVIFSPVYDDVYSGSYFFDKGVNMLNVAVSRAKDSFLVFGDMNIFRRKSETILPSKLLGYYLFNSPDNEITNVHIPQKTIREKPLYVLDTVEKHVEALRRAIQEARERVIIYSPWLTIRAVEIDGLDAVIRAKLQNDPRVTVKIYTDRYNNSAPEKVGSYMQAKQSIKAAGGTVVELEKIHQKIIVVDNSRFLVGSFNWLSSSRKTDPSAFDYQDNRTMVYSGADVGQLIENELKYISDREKEFQP